VNAFIKNLWLVLVLLIFVGVPSIRLRSQTFKTLHHFAAFTNGTNSEGANPLSGLILVSNTLYGTTREGGARYGGTVYSVNTDAAAFQVVFTFNTTEDLPVGDFVILDNLLYTTTEAPNGGSGFGGSIMMVPIDGSSQFPINWYDFIPSIGDGSGPEGVIFSDGLFYGVTRSGGQFGMGTVYAYDGSSVSNLYSFAGNDGANPNGSLTLYNGTFYGVTRLGGDWSSGTVYSVNADGSGFQTLHQFSGPTNGEGANPLAGLILWGGTLFGTTSAGGVYTNGTVFSIGTNGTGFTTLHSFTGKGEGAKPAAAMNLSGHTLYGTTMDGGASGLGTVFALGTNGTGFAILHSFNGVDGASPAAKMLLSSNTLYGTTFDASNSGTVFSLWLGAAPPQLTITAAGANVVLTWPVDGVSFLQSTSNLLPGTVWTRVALAPIILNGLNTLTNPIAGTQFFRLSQ
jgi:uncharacterized repeat protein (TIGR03803 family)